MNDKHDSQHKSKRLHYFFAVGFSKKNFFVVLLFQVCVCVCAYVLYGAQMYRRPLPRCGFHFRFRIVYDFMHRKKAWALIGMFAHKCITGAWVSERASECTIHIHPPILTHRESWLHTAHTTQQQKPVLLLMPLMLLLLLDIKARANPKKNAARVRANFAYRRETHQLNWINDCDKKELHSKSHS